MPFQGFPLAMRLFCLASIPFAMIGIAAAGEIGDAFENAEALLADGQPDGVWDEFDRATELFWAEAPLAFRVTALAESVAGYGQYQPRVDDRFAAGDELIAYLEPVGFGWTAIGEEFRVRFSIDLEIISPERGAILGAPDFATIERLARNRSREFQATLMMTLPDLPPDDYELRLTFHDAATGKSSTATLPFTLGR